MNLCDEEYIKYLISQAIEPLKKELAAFKERFPPHLRFVEQKLENGSVSGYYLYSDSSEQ